MWCVIVSSTSSRWSLFVGTPSTLTRIDVSTRTMSLTWALDPLIDDVEPVTFPKFDLNLVGLVLGEVRCTAKRKTTRSTKAKTRHATPKTPFHNARPYVIEPRTACDIRQQPQPFDEVGFAGRISADQHRQRPTRLPATEFQRRITVALEVIYLEA